MHICPAWPPGVLYGRKVGGGCKVVEVGALGCRVKCSVVVASGGSLSRGSQSWLYDRPLSVMALT